MSSSEPSSADDVDQLPAEGHIFYVYADSYDLGPLADQLETALDAFVREHRWQELRPWVVNQRSDEEQIGEDLPAWDLGLNVHLPPGRLTPATCRDLRAIFECLNALHNRFNMGFSLGLVLPNGVGEDIAYFPDVDFPAFIESVDPTEAPGSVKNGGPNR